MGKRILFAQLEVSHNKNLFLNIKGTVMKVFHDTVSTHRCTTVLVQLCAREFPCGFNFNNPTISIYLQFCNIYICVNGITIHGSG